MTTIGVVFVFLTTTLTGSLQQTTLKVGGRVTAAISGDINGDGQNELLVFWRQGYPPKTRFMVSVFEAFAGRIQPRPKQVLVLPEKAVAFDTGDVDGDRREDVLLLHNDGLWACKGRINGTLSPEPTSIVEVMTTGVLPNEDSLPRMELWVELSPDGRKGLLLPTIPLGPLALYERNDHQKWTLRQVLQVPFRMNLYTSSEDFRATREFGALFQLFYPRLQIADSNGDGRQDLFFFKEDSVALFRAREDLSFPKKPDFFVQFGLLTPEERIGHSVLVRGELGDINQDNRADLLFTKTLGGIKNMRSQLCLYLAKKDGRYSVEPDFQRTRKGYASSARLLDIDGDSQADLVWPYVNVGLGTLIRMALAGKLDLTFEVYFSRKGRIDPKPDVKIPASLGINFFSNQELTGPYPLLGYDFNGDGTNDVVVGHAGGGSKELPDRLEIHLGKKNKSFEDKPAWSTNWKATHFLLPFKVRKSDPPGLLIYFSTVKKLRGDVWLFHNPGDWK